MKEQFIPYELALKLKKLGFNEECFAWYVSEQYGLEIGKVISDDLIKDAILAPLWQQAFDWFREKHDLDSYIEKMIGGGSGIDEVYIGVIQRVHGTKEDFLKETNNVFDSYQEARQACLEKLIEIIER